MIYEYTEQKIQSRHTAENEESYKLPDKTSLNTESTESIRGMYCGTDVFLPSYLMRERKLVVKSVTPARAIVFLA